MPKISEELKKVRKNMGLTQQQMAAEIISPSFYSKVERGAHKISSDDLFYILFAHDVDYKSFFEDVTSDLAKSLPNKILNNADIEITKVGLYRAFCQKDLATINRMLQQIDKSPLSGNKMHYIQEIAIVLKALLDNNPSELSQEDKKIIGHELLENPSNLQSIYLFLNAMDAFSAEEIQPYVQIILHGVKKIKIHLVITKELSIVL